MPDNQTTEVDKLRDIMESLPDSADHVGVERREYSLTKGDVLLIYRIAKVACQPHKCPFGEEEQDTIKSVAVNINRTQKIASGIVIVGTVTAVLSGLWFAVKHVFFEWIVKGGKV